MNNHFSIKEKHLSGGIVDPQVEKILNDMKEADEPPFELLSPEEARELTLANTEKTDPPLIELAQIKDEVIQDQDGKIPVRIYVPEGQGPFPVMVYIHGGGWVVCNLDTHDGPCRYLARDAKMVVISVDYRLAPENKFPKAVKDCYKAIRWAAENAAQYNGNPNKLCIGGDSAGGNLSAVTAIHCRDRGEPNLAFQLLIYPVTNLSDMETESYEKFSEGYFLTRKAMQWFAKHYLNTSADAKHPFASPLLVDDLTQLPPALVLTAEFDPLRDEGEAYAKRLHQAAVPVECWRYNGLIHPFWSWGGVIDKTIEIYKEVGDYLQEKLAK